MAITRRAMHTMEASEADADLVATLLTSDSEAEATIAFTLLRDSVDESELLMLVNLRELLGELPQPPFRTGVGLDILERAAYYEATGRSYRRTFESSPGIFGIEFVGQGNQCDGIMMHAVSGKHPLLGDSSETREAALALYLNHSILLDAVLEALELLGLSLDPNIYVCADDFLGEHGAAAARDALGELF